MIRSLTVIIGLTLLFTLGVNNQLFGQEGLVADFPFNGNANDASGNSNDGMVDGPILTSDREGNPNSAYEFDGLDDRIVVVDNQSLWLEGDYTLDVWFMPFTVKSGTIFRKNSSQNSGGTLPAYGLSLSGTQHFVYNINTSVSGNGISSQQSALNLQYEPNTWYRLIARRTGDRIIMTINEFGTGIFNNLERNISGTTAYDTSPLIIGTRLGLASDTFHGVIDDIKIYDRFLTLEEVTGKDFDDDPTSTENVQTIDVKIYPNPSSDRIEFDLPDDFNPHGAYAKIYNSVGQEIITQKLVANKNVISISEFNPGSFFIEVYDNHRRSTIRFVKL